ncbi:hypothetical protein LXL04_036307 [Taraxacum kok-saghyz]
MARISELGYGCIDAALKIRILRKWIHHYRSNETWFLAVDTHGDSIQILGKRPNQHLLESKLRLFRCYEIEDYTCTESRPCTWLFQRLETVAENYWECFVKLDLTHESGREINTTLWNECVDDQEKFDSDILNTTSTKTVFAISALKISEYGGQPNLKSTAATHVYRNPVIRETEDLLQRLVMELGYDDMQQLPPILNRCRFPTYIFHVQMTKWSKPDNVYFVAIDVQNETNLPEQESSLLLTPPSSHKETPPSVSKPLLIQSSDTMNSAQKQIIYDDDDEIEKTKSIGKRKQLILQDEDELDVMYPSKKERYPDE